MYKFPDDFDTNVFIGNALEDICFSKNQVSLGFSNNISIIAEADISHQQAGESVTTIIVIPVATSNLMGLLEHRIVAAFVQEGEKLILRFDSGDVLSFCDIAEDFESYHLMIGGHAITI
jgi:hypothetical protein